MYHDIKLRLQGNHMINTWSSGPLPTGEEISCGQVTVTRAGSAVQMTSTPTALRGGVFIAKVAGDGTNAYVGTEGVSATTGIKVGLNQPMWIEARDLSHLWIDSDTNGSVWSYMAF